jgi:hypothetical protein
MLLIFLIIGARYDGQWLKDKACGHGIMTYPDGSRFFNIKSLKHYNIIIIFNNLTDTMECGKME